MNKPDATDPLTVLYDGACPLCQREIAHLQGLARRGPDSALCFVDVSETSNPLPADERAALMARFHVQRSDGTRLSGAAAFVTMWARLPGWRWLARLAQLPGALPMLELAYRGFLRFVRACRPWPEKPARAPEADHADHPNGQATEPAA